jgi:hypothetical protein
VGFLASVEAAADWQRTHPEARVLSAAQGFALGRAVLRLRLGAALDAPGPAALARRGALP